jgi:hypothetical protein
MITLPRQLLSPHPHFISHPPTKENPCPPPLSVNTTTPTHKRNPISASHRPPPTAPRPPHPARIPSATLHPHYSHPNPSLHDLPLICYNCNRLAWFNFTANFLAITRKKHNR